MDESSAQQILDELRRQTNLTKKINIIIPAIFLVFFVFAVLFTPYVAGKYKAKSQQNKSSWNEVNSYFYNGNLQDALRVAQNLTEQNPNYWYGYSYLGIIYNALGDNIKAESNYAKAYELFPTKDNKDMLDAIRSVIKK